jgi:DNA topoisomerase VI subunit B
MAHTLHRTTFETSRLLEYFSPKELSMQLGAEPSRWGLVLLKELVDNALDACETAGTAPHIRITLSPDGCVVEDNGPGLPASTVARSLDYRVRVNDKAYYISPTRGQLGNALKCLWAAPYVVNPESPGVVQVTSQGVIHRIAVALDRIVQEHKIAHTVTEAPFVKTGTLFQVEASQLAVSPAGGRPPGERWEHITAPCYSSTTSDAANPDTLHRVFGLPRTRFFCALFPPNEPASW